MKNSCVQISSADYIYVYTYIYTRTHAHTYMYMYAFSVNAHLFLISKVPRCPLDQKVILSSSCSLIF